MERAIGPYRVLYEIGRGGSGLVYRAVAPDGRPVALKLLVAGRLANAGQRERFRREAEALQRVRHPQVVALLDQGEEQGAPWLALEWVEGESLEARLQREGPLAPRAAAELVRQLALALQHCHERGVLHRDLKPPNVLLRGGREPLLVDFGLTLVLQSEAGRRLTRTGQLLGTPGWWAPEQAHGERLATGPATDVYGLGALLFGALTGEPPQAGGSLLEVLQALARDPVPPSRLRPGLPADLDAICLRCLARAPHERYPDAGAVALALGRWLESVDASPSARAGTFALALGLAVVGCALAASLVLSAPRAAPDPQPASAASAGTQEARGEGAGDLLRAGQAHLLRGEHARARGALERAANDPAHAPEALWTLHDLHAREDPAFAGILDEPLRALLARGAAAPEAARRGPWLELAQVVELLDRHDPQAPARAQALARAWPELAWAHLLDGFGAGRIGHDPVPGLEWARERTPGWGVICFLLAFAAGGRDRPDEVQRLVDEGLADRSLGPTARARLLVQKAVSYRGQGRGNLAIETIEAALREDPRLEDGLTLQVMFRLQRAQGDDVQVATASMRELERLTPDLSPLARAARAAVFQATGDVLRALADLDHLLEEQAKYPDAHLQRATLLSELGRWVEAEREIAQHLRDRPDDPRGLLARAELQERLGDPQAATDGLAVFERALARQGGTPPPCDLRARLLLRAGRLEEAREEARAAEEMPSEEWQARLTLGRAQAMLDGDTEAARVNLERVLAERPQFREAWVARSQVCARLSRWAEVETCLQRARALAPLGVEENVNLGMALIELGRAAEARPVLEAALAERPDGPLALNGHARACLALRDLPAALASAERALALPPERLPDSRLRPVLRWARALALAGLGRRDEAEVERTALLADQRLDPTWRAEVERGFPPD